MSAGVNPAARHGATFIRLFGRLGEDLGDDFLQRRVFDAYVFQCVIRQHGGEDLRDLLAIDAELHARFDHFDDFAVAAQYRLAVGRR